MFVTNTNLSECNLIGIEFKDDYYLPFNTSYVEDQIKKGNAMTNYSESSTDPPYIKHIKSILMSYSGKFETMKNCAINFKNETTKCVFTVMLVRVDDIHLITPSMFSLDSGYTNKSLLELFHNHIKFQNLQVSIVSNIINSIIDNIILEVADERLYNTKALTFKDDLKIKLFDYQIDNINWMIDRETEGYKFSLVFDKIIDLPDGRKFNYNQCKMISNEEHDKTNIMDFRGGIIMDEVGIGKTVQILSLIKNNPEMKTVILVPAHLVSHWHSQMEKHFKSEFNNVSIVSFDEMAVIDKSYERLIIDEIHEIFTQKKENQLFKLPCIKFRWGLSATPFPEGIKSLLNMLQYLIWDPSISFFSIKNYHLLPLWKNMFRCNTHKSIIKEVDIKKVTEINHFIGLLPIEKSIYDTEAMNGKTDNLTLRKICCNLHMIYNDGEVNETLSKKVFIETTIQYYKVKHEQSIAHEISLNKTLDEIKTQIKKVYLIPVVSNELTQSLHHYENLVKEAQREVESKKSQYEHITSCLNDSEECPICMDTLPSPFMITKCKHFFCTPCITNSLKHVAKCPVCRTPTTLKECTLIADNVLFPTSSKISEILKIVNSSTNKFILYTQFPSIVHTLIEVLNSLNIPTTALGDADPKVFDKYRVIVASSTNQSSGIDLTYFNNMIIFEPYIHDYRYMKAYEKQIIGRINRLGQTKSCNVFRIISNKTIESDIFFKS